VPGKGLSDQRRQEQAAEDETERVLPQKPPHARLPMHQADDDEVRQTDDDADEIGGEYDTHPLTPPL
jgi:hypothetical protein